MQKLTAAPGAHCDDKTCAKCPCLEYCPLDSAMRVIGGKWRVPIICALHQDGNTRFNELKRKIRGVTNTALAGALKELEECGLVVRTQYQEMPVRVEYHLTDSCEDLLPILGNLAKWGIKIGPPADKSPEK
jgi:DNA-binding HxlR family transcriptional regulator